MVAKLLRPFFRSAQQLPEAVPGGVAVYRSRWVPAVAGRLSGMGAPAAAVTLGDAILVHPDIAITPRLLRHELAHVRQWRKQPLLFPLRYVLGHLRYGYHDNPFEVEARAAEQTERPS
jgi:hypothetical protein